VDLRPPSLDGEKPPTRFHLPYHPSSATAPFGHFSVSPYRPPSHLDLESRVSIVVAISFGDEFTSGIESVFAETRTISFHLEIRREFVNFEFYIFAFSSSKRRAKWNRYIPMQSDVSFQSMVICVSFDHEADDGDL
jgi:hypothetical protein